MKLRYLLLLSIVFGLHSELLAVSSTFSADSLRKMSMGGTGVATSMDDSAMMNNPAGLAYTKFAVKFPRLGVALNEDTMNNYEDLQELFAGEGTEQEQIEKLEELAPLDIGVKGWSSPGISLTTPGFGIGVYGGGHAIGELYEAGLSVFLELEGYADMVPVIGFAQEFEVFGKPTAMGVSAKFINRNRIYDKANGDDRVVYNTDEILGYINDTEAAEGIGVAELSGVGFDVGFLRPINSYKFGKGHWGISVQHIGATLTGDKLITSGNVESEESAEEVIPVEASIGFAVENASLRNLLNWDRRLLGNTQFAADYMFVSDNKDYRKNIHLGVEQKMFYDAFKLRGGINQGFVVGGVGLDIKLWKLPLLHANYAVYVEEFGEKVGYNNEKFQAFEIGVLF